VPVKRTIKIYVLKV